MATPKINHPKSGTTLKPAFVAFGTDPKTESITGQLMSGTHVIATGQSARPGPRWIIVFNSVPVGGPYTLQILHKGTVIVSADNLTVKGDFDVSISWPPNGTQGICDDNFVAYGTSSAGGQAGKAAMTGTVPANNQAVDATNTESLWYAAFPPLNADTYSLAVADADGGAGDHKRGLGLIDC